MAGRLLVGDTITLKNTFTLAKVGTDPTTVTLTVYAPDGTSTTPATTGTGNGQYSATFLTAQAGLHRFSWSGVGVVDDVADGSFRVFTLADAKLYASLEELKAALGVDDQRDDQSLATALNTACRTIDRFTGRTFWRGTAGEVRYFTATRSALVHIDDAVAVTAVDSDGGTGAFGLAWTVGTHYYLAPRAAAAFDAPFTQLQALNRGFPAGDEFIRVTGTFGWPVVPAEVVQATLLQAARIWKRTREAPFGIAGLNLEGGGMRLLAKLDPDVELLIRPLQKPLVA